MRDQTAPERDWNTLMRRHMAFWSCAAVDRPLICALYDAYVDTELVARTVGAGELTPDRVNVTAILPEYDKVARARELIGDDMIGLGEPPLGIPWLEAMCGCRVMVPEGRSLWPEPPVSAHGQAQAAPTITDISVSPDNPWLGKLLEAMRTVVDYVGGRYGVSIGHMRGPTDILVALLGSEPFSLALYDDPERITRLAKQAAGIWLHVARSMAEIVPPYRGGYVMRQFGLWSPGPSVWLQDDTSSMMSLSHYRQFFLEPMRARSVFPYGVLHLHIQSLHIAETLVSVRNIRAINVYFDSPLVSLHDAMPVLRRLQERRMPLILAKTVYEGLTLEEYREILDSLSPNGLSVHLKAASIEEGREVMANVTAQRRR